MSLLTNATHLKQNMQIKYNLRHAVKKYFVSCALTDPLQVNQKKY